MEQSNSNQGGEKRRIMVERQEETSQRTGMNDLWTWATVWELTMGAEARTGRGGQMEKN